MTVSSPPRTPLLSRRERVFLLALIGLMVVTRLPFATHMLYHWDSVQFVLGMGEYNVAEHQPHPPGYFLYVMLGRVMHALVSDPNRALVLLSILAGAATAPLLYLLARALYGPVAAAAACLLFSSSPVVWLYGTVALSDIAEGFAVTAVALLCWRARNGSARHVVLSAVTLAVAGGIRQQSLVLLLPLWLYCAWPHGVRRLAVAAVLGALAAAAWIWPMMALSGGFHAYREAAALIWSATQGSVVAEALGWSAPLQRAGTVLAFCLQALSLGLIPLALVTYLHLRGRQGLPRPSKHPAATFLAIWILFPLAFYALATIVRGGILMTLYPALFIAAGAATASLGKGRGESTGGGPPAINRGPGGRAATFLASPRGRTMALAGALAALNAVLFLAQPGANSAQALREHDRDLRARVDAVRQRLPPAVTIISTHGQHFHKGFRLAAYYLPEYRVVEEAWGGDRPWRLGFQGRMLASNNPPVPAGTQYIVLFDRERGLPPDLQALFPRLRRSAIPLPSGGELAYYQAPLAP